MTFQYEDDAYRSQIYARMQEKDTAELLEIWQENNRTEWTEEAFDAIRAILSERLGQVPEQGKPEDESDEMLDEEEVRGSGVENSEDRRLYRLVVWANTISWASLFAAIGFTFFHLINTYFLCIHLHSGQIFGL